ncbi:MAG: hypothetical protein JWQ00_1971 [Noviherbaspirillum sp.]|nr:hypothetical protein [Noviherbaspirillum sp.]
MTATYARRSTLLASMALVAMLAGCQKQTDAPKPTTSVGTSAPTAPAAAVTTTNQSVAAPASAMPAPDTAIAPQAPAAQAKTTDADGPTQATPKDLSKREESTNMPLAGQVNNHSTPATVNEQK